MIPDLAPKSYAFLNCLGPSLKALTGALNKELTCLLIFLVFLPGLPGLITPLVQIECIGPRILFDLWVAHVIFLQSEALASPQACHRGRSVRDEFRVCLSQHQARQTTQKFIFCYSRMVRVFKRSKSNASLVEIYSLNNLKLSQ